MSTDTLVSRDWRDQRVGKTILEWGWLVLYIDALRITGKTCFILFFLFSTSSFTFFSVVLTSSTTKPKHCLSKI